MNSATANLWLIKYDPKLVLTQVAMQSLGTAQIDRAEQLKGRRKLEYLVGRLLLIEVIEREGLNGQAEPAKDWHIMERSGLSPLVFTPSFPLVTSISHSKTWLGVLSAQISSSELLGLDIEYIRPSFTDQMGAYFCNEKQLALVAEMKKPIEVQHYLTRLWTQKEAYFKSKEMPILNSQTKAVAFNRDDRMHSAKLGKNFFLSVFCSLPVTVVTHFLSIDENGKTVFTEKETLDWELPSGDLSGFI